MNLNEKNVQTYKDKKAIEHYSIEEIKPIEKDLISKYFKSPVLDLGCGIGRTTKYLYDNGFNVVGVDIIKDMIHKAKSLYPKISFKVGDACKLKFKRDSFNTVFFSFNGLDYIFPEKKRIIAIKEIERVTKKKGVFVFSSHNPLALFFRFRPKFLLRNIKKRTLFSNYKIEAHHFGELYTYYSSPKKQIEVIEKNTKFRLIGFQRKGIKDLHPHYIFVKN